MPSNQPKDFQRLEHLLKEGAKKGGPLGADEPLTVELFELLLGQAIFEKASDAHFQNFDEEVLVRFRVDGKLHKKYSLTKNVYEGILHRVKFLTHLRLDVKNLPQGGSFRTKKEGEELSVRVAILPTFRGEDLTWRLSWELSRPKTLEDLGLTGRNLELLENEIRTAYGAIICSGPTGSGKTTTMYNIILRLKSEELSVATIEDPIEYPIEGVRQVEVEGKEGLTFAAGLRSILRHDPDVILVGEIMDQETAQIAVEASLTGHKVLSTLHANNAVESITRLLDLGVRPFLIGSSTDLIIGQRLVSKTCSDCRQKVEPNPGVVKILKEKYNVEIAGIENFRGSGCKTCAGTGAVGRTGVFEVFEVSDEIRELIYSNASLKTIRAQAEKEGFKSIIYDALEKVKQGMVPLEEVLKVLA